MDRVSALRQIACLGVGAVLVTLVGVAGSQRSTPEQEQPRPTADTVTVRVLYREWGFMETMECYADDWGWDSVTWRLAEGGEAAVTGFGSDFHMRLRRMLSSDSAWLEFNPRQVSRIDGNGPWPLSERDHPGPDSVLISSRPVNFTTNTIDGGRQYRIRTVRGWPEPKRRPHRTTPLSGKVVDATSGRPVSARVMVLGTKIATFADRTGRFVLADVPVGTARLHACAGCYLKTLLEVSVPCDSLELRLGRNPRCTYPD